VAQTVHHRIRRNGVELMCGIAGIIAPEAKRYESHIRSMITSLKHRGPDADGVLFFDSCVLGHTRLSIIDLATGAQPMRDACTENAVTFNGEIYGYREIKKQLTDYPFASTSDTEVILALYNKYSGTCAAHLPGMFSFAIWDDHQKLLYCARDRFGEKPFYYATGRGGEFIFASEIKAILATGLIDPVLDMESIAYYLQFLYVPPGRTIYKNVFTLPPAHQLKYSKKSIIIERYWELPECRYTISPMEAEQEFKRLFEQAVRRQLVADVPVGAFLSGGLDSSTIVAVASKYKENLKTFSFLFETLKDDPVMAKETALMYGTDHLELTDQSFDIADALLTMQKVYDEPFADSSSIPTYIISRLAREHTTVVLSGDAGDELLAGYSFWYHPLMMMEPGFFAYVAGNLATGAAFWKRRIGDAQIRLGVQLRKAFGNITAAHTAQKKYFQDQELAELGLKPFVNTGFYRETNSLDDALRADLTDYMPGDILVKTDRATMAHGLELRTPFLDVDFASFCISLPWQLKMNLDQDKFIMRRAYEQAWPQSVRTRGKEGFGAPVQAWLKRPSVAQLKNRYLCNTESALCEILPSARIAHYTAGDDYRTWILLTLALWLDTHPWKLDT
jgi:asparagine synthase (glutamine-hydrolysing)